MKKLDEIRQKIEADRQQEEERAAERSRILVEIAALEDQIDDAIADGKESTAEKLLNDQNALKNRLAVSKKIGARRADASIYFKDLVAVSREMVADLQPKADKVYAEMEKAHRLYLEKKAALAKILNDAAQIRTECWKVACVGPAYEDPRYDQILSVQHDRYAFDMTFREKEQIQQIDPDFFENVSFANSYGQFKNDQ